MTYLAYHVIVTVCQISNLASCQNYLGFSDYHQTHSLAESKHYCEAAASLTADDWLANHKLTNSRYVSGATCTLVKEQGT